MVVVRLICMLIILSLSITSTTSFAKPHRIHRVFKVSPRPVAPSIYGTSELEAELNAIVNAEANIAIAVYVKSMQTGAALYARNINNALMPASTLKLMTAVAALLYLGPDYHFSTELRADSTQIKDGILEGNLYIRLSGDPTLTYQNLVELTQSLQDQKIRGTKGNVILDVGAFDQHFYGPGWEGQDKNFCFSAPISSSIINHNCLPFKIMPTRPGQLAKLLVSDKFFYPPIRNAVMTKKRHARHCALRLSQTLNDGLQIAGCIPAGHFAWTLNYVISDVAQYNRVLFKDLLRQLKFQYKHVQFGSVPKTAYLIDDYPSPPLKEMLRDMLKKSDNIIASALFKKIGQLYTHDIGSWQSGSYAVSRILEERAGLHINGMRILDGSGLSASNLLTSAQLMTLLQFAYRNELIKEPFMTALPVAGVDGTLKHRMYNLRHRVLAKTGTISGVNTLAGYTLSADHLPLAFVIMINGNRGDGWRYRTIEDKIATALSRYRG